MCRRGSRGPKSPTNAISPGLQNLVLKGYSLGELCALTSCCHQLWQSPGCCVGTSAFGGPTVPAVALCEVYSMQSTHTGAARHLRFGLQRKLLQISPSSAPTLGLVSGFPSIMIKVLFKPLLFQEIFE